MCFFCSCANATPKEKINELACPYALPAEKDFPASWVTARKIIPGRLKLEQIDIAFGSVAELKNSLAPKERKFNAEITDDWTYIKDRAEYKAEYSEDHDEITMMCTYGRNRK